MRLSFFSSQPQVPSPARFPEEILDFHCFVETCLREILAACQEAHEARRSVPKASEEWHKLTGEILAYGKMTHMFYQLRRRR
jgi:hypothetical protein